MTLTGKCKSDFEKWFEQSEHRKFVQITGFMSDTFLVFYKLPFSMQYGVYEDFFDSVGYTIVINSDWYFTVLQLAKGEGDGKQTFEYYVYYPDKNPAEYDSEFKTRQEARTKAIEKANEIYNQGFERKELEG